VWKWGPEVGGNLWRTTGDITDKYDRMSQIGFMQAGLAKFAGPGHWNDPDMLEVGNGGMSFDEYKTHMTLWTILAAPLLAGNDLSKMTAETKELLMNKEVIAVDQDRLGKQGDRVWAQGPEEIWAKPLSGGAKAVGLFNRAETPRTISLKLSTIGFGANAKVRDLWAHKDVQATNGVYTVTVPKHGGTVTHVVCDNAETLVYIANQGCLTPHVGLQRVDKNDYPDQMVFDLDPPSEDFAVVRALALEHRRRVVKRVGQNMDTSIAPRDHLTVEPDPAVAVVKCRLCGGSHDARLG